ncbi:MAG: PIG-L family deacetylase [Bryobacterales bacterium]|nr:PIG-L family deacetylase [Bryobacterales bacterium]
MTTEKKLQVAVFGAHPDDCEAYFGGTAALFASLGHQVTFVSMTNGDAGHHVKGGGELARIRLEEANEARKRLGIANYFVLDYHDGELLPTLDLRRHIVRIIRRYGADLVFTHRPNDYHPDHRYGSMAVQDAAYMVMVPNVCPDVEALRQNPVFLYLQDHFRKPYPFQPDVVVGVDSVWQKKMDGMTAHVSQFGEWLPWIDGYEAEVSSDPLVAARQAVERYTFPIDDAIRARLEVFYGDAAAHVCHAEAFEVCEYGRQPAQQEILELFPMLPRAAAG